MIVDIYEYFKNHPNFNRLIGDDYLFVEYKCPISTEDFQLRTESHLITYVINGRKDWITQSTTYELKAGESLFIRKGLYTTKQHLNEDYCVILFFLTDDFIKNFISENNSFSRKINTRDSQEQVFPISSNETFHSLIESIFHYLKQGADIPRSLVELKFRELLFNIVLNPGNKDILAFFNAISNSAKTNMEDMMMKHFRADLTMIELASLCGRSLSSFKRDFKNQFHTTPASWLKTKRLEYAKMLILGTDLNINEVCYESGFKNNSHFITAFKAEFNMSPNQFKTNIK